MDFGGIVNNKTWNTIASSCISKYVAYVNGKVDIYYDYSDTVDKSVDLSEENTRDLKLAHDKKYL